MELNYIHEFLEAAKHLNLSRAAEQLFISRSSLSRHISELEKEMHTQLFIRKYHLLELTDAGRYLVREGTRLTSLAQDIFNTLQTFQNKEFFNLSICSVNFSCPELFQGYQEFQSRHPNVEFIVLNSSLPEIFNTLERNQVDFIITFSFSLWGKNLNKYRKYTISESNFCAVMSSGHPLATYGILTLNDLKPFRVRFPMSPLRLQEQLLFYKKGQKETIGIPAPKEFMDPTSLDTISLILNSSTDIALLPLPVAKIMGNSCIFKDISDLQSPFEVVLLYNSSNVNPCLKQFLNEQIFNKFPRKL